MSVLWEEEEEDGTVPGCQEIGPVEMNYFVSYNGMISLRVKPCARKHFLPSGYVKPICFGT